MPQARTTRAERAIMAIGAVMLFASFLQFAGGASTWSGAWFPLATLLPLLTAAPVHGGPVSSTVWSNGFLGIATLPVLLGAVMAGQVGLTAFATRVKVPEHVLGLAWDQIHLTLAAQAVLLMLSWLAV